MDMPSTAVFNSLGLKPPNTWEELIAVTLALRRLHGFSSGPGNLDDYIAVGEVAPPLGLRLPAVQGSIDVRRWPQPGSLSSNWTLMPPGVPPALNSSEPKMALCLDLALHCKAGDLLAAILASLTQSKGTQQAQPLQSCSALNRRFVQGNCAMTIDWDVAMMYVK
ncbi:hypothetical protein HaLaN_19968 [Haematococcus lacustris]|uniref:Uncharacterized protein n=1 Tax=Haematococcus lacustris TaxID=44745 RepID=A0A699ZUX0_HAELA|nr:hypothetical protein HaLaN_19968 [Haematococcus lacustris]